jgi:hypothetical protein
MTLNQLLSEIGSVNGSTSDSTDSMTVSSVIIGNGSSPSDLVHVAYVGEGEDLFMIGATGKFQYKLF